MVYYQCHFALIVAKDKKKFEKQRQPNISSFCLQNVTANHRVNDVIATEDGHQTLVGRFMYGPLDMVTLTGEKVREQWSTLIYTSYLHATKMSVENLILFSFFFAITIYNVYKLRDSTQKSFSSIFYSISTHSICCK